MKIKGRISSERGGRVSQRLGVVEIILPRPEVLGEAVDIDFATAIQDRKTERVHGKNGVEFKQYAVRVQDDDMYVVAFAVRRTGSSCSKDTATAG
jgi:hypothetical protein